MEVFPQRFPTGVNVTGVCIFAANEPQQRPSAVSLRVILLEALFHGHIFEKK